MHRANEDRRRVGVVGASGRLGGLIVGEARRSGFQVRAFSRADPAAGARANGSDGRGPQAKNLAGLDAVIVAAPQGSDSLYRAALEAGCHVVDTGIREDAIRAALDLDALAGARGLNLIVMGGLAPGLSGMLGRDMARRFPSAAWIDVVLVQNARGTAGRQGVRDMLDMLSDAGRAPLVKLRAGAITGPDIPSRHAFTLPTPEAAFLKDRQPGPALRYLTLFDAARMNRSIRVLRGLRTISEWAYGRVRDRVATARSKQPPPAEEGVRLIAVARNADGSVPGREDLPLASDYGATARIAVALTELALTRPLPRGAGHPARFSDWRSVAALAFGGPDMPGQPKPERPG